MVNSYQKIKIFQYRYILVGCILGCLVSCGPTNIETLTIRGSDTEVNLALQLAETYMTQDSLISIAVTGGGSGSGLAALINGKTDIANSSREMTQEERALAADRSVTPVPIIFAVDAIVLIVHASNPVQSLSPELIGAIFRGEITHWSLVGGPDIPISLYGRQSNSGTFTYFRETLLKAEYSPEMKQMNGTAQIVEGIKQDVAGIGYVGIGYIVNKTGVLTAGLNVLSIQTESNIQVSPLETATIVNGEYPIVRPLYQYTNGMPSGRARSFIQFELSAEGQTLVQQNGYFPITAAHRRQNQELGIYGDE